MREPITRVDFQAGERHFVDHMAPLWFALPEERRGGFYTGFPNPTDPRFDLAARQAKSLGIRPKPSYLPRGHEGLAVVCSVSDLAAGRREAPRTRFVFTEHGCGITYNRRGPSFLGSKERKSVDLIITPNPRAAAIQRDATPAIRVESIGSSPRLDRWAGYVHEQNTPPVVALSFHWDSDWVLETKSALYHYRKRLDVLQGQGWEVIGHSHPRIWSTAKVVYEHWGIEPVRQFEEVMDRADLYCVDNSSTLYEFAATDRPVVVMNCPRYRRDIHHGLRFWDHIPGIQVDEPDELAGAVALALEDPVELRRLREEAMERVYPQRDGKAGERAAALILETLDGMTRVSQRRSMRPRWGWRVFDSAGEVVKDGMLVQYEAQAWAERIGGSIERVRLDAGAAHAEVGMRKPEKPKAGAIR